MVIKNVTLKFVFCADLQYSDSGSSELEEVETKDAAEGLVQLSVRPGTCLHFCLKIKSTFTLAFSSIGMEHMRNADAVLYDALAQRTCMQMCSCASEARALY